MIAPLTVVLAIDNGPNPGQAATANKIIVINNAQLANFNPLNSSEDIDFNDSVSLAEDETVLYSMSARAGSTNLSVTNPPTKVSMNNDATWKNHIVVALNTPSYPYDPANELHTSAKIASEAPGSNVAENPADTPEKAAAIPAIGCLP